MSIFISSHPATIIGETRRLLFSPVTFEDCAKNVRQELPETMPGISFPSLRSNLRHQIKNHVCYTTLHKPFFFGKVCELTHKFKLSDAMERVQNNIKTRAVAVPIPQLVFGRSNYEQWEKTMLSVTSPEQTMLTHKFKLSDAMEKVQNNTKTRAVAVPIHQLVFGRSNYEQWEKTMLSVTSPETTTPSAADQKPVTSITTSSQPKHRPTAAQKTTGRSAADQKSTIADQKPTTASKGSTTAAMEVVSEEPPKPTYAAVAALKPSIDKVAWKRNPSAGKRPETTAENSFVQLKGSSAPDKDNKQETVFYGIFEPPLVFTERKTMIEKQREQSSTPSLSPAPQAKQAANVAPKPNSSSQCTSMAVVAENPPTDSNSDKTAVEAPKEEPLKAPSSSSGPKTTSSSAGWTPITCEQLKNELEIAFNGVTPCHCRMRATWKQLLVDLKQAFKGITPVIVGEYVNDMWILDEVCSCSTRCSTQSLQQDQCSELQCIYLSLSLGIFNHTATVLQTPVSALKA